MANNRTHYSKAIAEPVCGFAKSDNGPTGQCSTAQSVWGDSNCFTELFPFSGQNKLNKSAADQIVFDLDILFIDMF